MIEQRFASAPPKPRALAATRATNPRVVRSLRKLERESATGSMWPALLTCRSAAARFRRKSKLTAGSYHIKLGMSKILAMLGRDDDKLRFLISDCVCPKNPQSLTIVMVAASTITVNHPVVLIKPSLGIVSYRPTSSRCCWPPRPWRVSPTVAGVTHRRSLHRPVDSVLSPA